MAELTVKKVTVAIFGMGRAGGGIHFPNLLHNVRACVKYVVDLDMGRIEAVLKQYQTNHVTAVAYSDCDKVFQDPDVDAILVCTPTEYHEEVCLKALASKKSVLCEKPLAKSDEGIKAIYDLASKNQVAMFCALNRRFDPNVRHIYSCMQDCTLGKVQSVRMCSRDGHRTTIDYIKTSGGFFMDTTIHDLDIMCFLMGAFPSQVYATGYCHDPDIAAINDYDTVVIVLNFPSGAIGTIECSRNSTYGHEGYLEVFGAKGALKTGDMRPINVGHYTESGTCTQPIHGNFHTRYFDSYKIMLDHFINAVLGQSLPEVTMNHVTRLTQLANACRTSAQTGQKIEF